jgi:hypothetical protein
VRREAGKEQGVEVHCDEGIAIHIGPEPCVIVREGRGEASVGESIGQPSSRESPSPECRRRGQRGRQHGRVRSRQHPFGSAWSQAPACADAACSGTGRSPVRPPRACLRRPASGRRGADDVRAREVRPCHRVAVKPTNKAAQSVAEPVEPRAGTKGNAGRQSPRRAQNPVSVSQALERIRQAVRFAVKHLR